MKRARGRAACRGRRTRGYRGRRFHVSFTSSPVRAHVSRSVQRSTKRLPLTKFNPTTRDVPEPPTKLQRNQTVESTQPDHCSAGPARVDAFQHRGGRQRTTSCKRCCLGGAVSTRGPLGRKLPTTARPPASALACARASTRAARSARGRKPSGQDWGWD
jgi:hypothetical protein